MNSLKVILWGSEIGRLLWNPKLRHAYFIFNPEIKDRPDIAPILCPKHSWNNLNPVYGDSRKIYQGLPPFIADSLPDSWGNKIFERWVKENNIPNKKITPLYKLMFIGSRGMGALEFQPEDKELLHNGKIDLKSLYELSLDIAEEKNTVQINNDSKLTMNALLSTGTSAGGRQMKAIIAMNNKTGEIRSGQINLKDFEYFIIKFQDNKLPLSEIEMAYCEMAVNAGIEMEYSSLFNVEGINHFITRRFDRESVSGNKIFMQTLAAINPEAQSYEDLISTCRTLGLSEKEMSQIYRRMVFNVIANNTDDHNKNFSFLMDKSGKWKISPAYDLTFIFNTYATGPDTDRCLSVNGLYRNISKEDILTVAKNQNISYPERIIDEVVASLKNFDYYASKYSIPKKYADIIEKSIYDNLINFGYKDKISLPIEYRSPSGKSFTNLHIYKNEKGIYEIRAIINGLRQRRFINMKDPDYSSLTNFQMGKESNEVFFNILEKHFLNKNKRGMSL